ncbi:MAG: NAD(P)H-binding protein [Saprospiraceae bacterium]|nr:NAD(P)H-binding protein [Saprospiraceae bacterium]
MNTPSPERIALIFGSSGLVGRELQTFLLDSKEYSLVKSFVRMKSEVSHPKLQEFLIDFDKPESFIDHLNGTHLFLSLGTTMAKAGSKDAFRKVDYNYPLTVAKLAKQQRVENVYLVSAVGADPDSSVFYSKVKGELERDILASGFKSVHIFRPSLLLGERSENRAGESVAQKLSGVIGMFSKGPFSKYHPISGKDVAQSIYEVSLKPGTSQQIYEYKEMQNAIW